MRRPLLARLRAENFFPQDRAFLLECVAVIPEELLRAAPQLRADREVTPMTPPGVSGDADALQALLGVRALRREVQMQLNNLLGHADHEDAQRKLATKLESWWQRVSS